MSKKLLLVMNPLAGVKKSNRYLTDILAIFAGQDYECTVQLTTAEKRAASLVEAYGKDKELIICIGGDGTLNEVISGILTLGIHPNIGYIPSGSTNDFASSLSLSSNPVKAAQDIALGEKTDFDIGLFNSRPFTYVASFGVFTKASYSAPRDLKNMLGHLAYILEGMKELGEIKSEHISMQIEEKVIEGDYLFGAVCNSTRVGGGVIKFSKSVVDMNDGLFEVVLIKTPQNPSELMQLLVDLNAGNYTGEGFDFFTAKSILVKANPDMAWTLDGEYQKGGSVIEIKNIHSAVSLVINKPKEIQEVK